MKITIVYDNTSLRDDLEADWGFSCYIEHLGTNILFDTGT
ncbi:MAG: MBL fold metallo-hydrolase, partial [Candidatus Heimdallarchaeota archaeon]|nr:MBL fold metallo-hydrolase [Candidatus Heimdallarchaeota archaeon]